MFHECKNSQKQNISVAEIKLAIKCLSVVTLNFFRMYLAKFTVFF